MTLNMNWKNALEEPPADGQYCWITSGNPGLECSQITGPIIWDAKFSAFIDAFSASDGTRVYPPGDMKVVIWWLPEGDISVPEMEDSGAGGS